MSHVRRWGTGAVVGAVVAGVALVSSVSAGPGEPRPMQAANEGNPPIDDSCGIDVTLVLDASGSISSSNAVDTVRDAGRAFLDALADTGSRARLTQFATLTEELAAFAEVTQASIEQDGSFDLALRRYYNPKPPRPSNVNIYSYRGSGSPQSTSSWNSANSSNQYTNWAASLAQAGDQPTELVVYVTDGDPTAYDFDQAADPFDQGPPPDVGVNTDRGSAAAITLERSTAAADALKAGGARILAVGVGSALNNPSSQARLQAIAGPLVVEDDDLDGLDSINDVDVALVTDFDQLAAFLRSVVSELCAPSLSIRKLAQSAESAEYVSTPGWDITAAPSVTGSFGWILPDTDAAALPRCGNPTDPTDEAPRTCATDDSGLANFQWEPDPSEAISQVDISETPQPGFTPGRPGPDNDWTCRIKDVDGTESVVSGELGVTVPNGFDLSIESEQIVTCSIYNSFDYEPGIDIVKVNSPTIVRGDLPADQREVTSTYSVTNTGNAALSGVVVSDASGPDRTCSPVEYASGDVDADGLLDLTEEWVFTCTTPVGGPTGTYVNTADVVASSPDQQQVSASDADDVDVVNPAIELQKVVEGANQGPADRIVVPVGTDVTYTFTATNTGDTVLDGVALDDPQCDAPPTTSDATDGVLPGETVVFECDVADVVIDTINIATVTATPNIPGYTGSNPDVTDDAEAEVETFTAAIQLLKTVDQSVVFPGTAVTYTFEVQLPPDATTSIAPSNPTGTTSVPRADWVVDPRCAPTVYQGGDTNGDEVLDDGEVWTYTCTRTLGESDVNAATIGGVVNVATVDGVPAITGFPGDPVRDEAAALVRLVVPLIDVTKTASRDTVLDPPASCPPATLPCAPLIGPDAPTPRTVDYLFEVRNPGVVPLDLTDGSSLPPDPADARITDTVGGVTACTPTFVPGGDTNADGYLDTNETWVFECTGIALTKADAANGFDVVNQVAVTGNGILPGQPPVRSEAVQATDTARVQVITPNYTLTKTASETLVRPGTDVTYTYELTHTGDPVGLDVIGVVDDLCAPVEYVSGDDAPPAGNGLLQSGETWIYECTQTISFPEDDPDTIAVENEVVNEAVAIAIGPLGNLYARDATETVQVFDPAIQLEKEVDDPFVPVGTEVSYTFTVTNIGNDITLDELTDIIIADEAEPVEQPSCTFPQIIDQGDDDDVLAVGEVWVYGCSATIDVDSTNLAVVVGTDRADGRVLDFADAFVAVYEPGIDIVKTADPVELPLGGGEVVYTYEVTNTGDVPLADVASQITDDRCSPVTYVSGDDDGNELLTGAVDLFETGPTETWRFTCTTTITDDTLNTVTVDGTPVRPGPEGPEVLGPDVSATDTAFVRVLDDSGGAVPTTTVPAPTTTVGPGIIPPTGGGSGALVPAFLAVVVGAVLVLLTRRRWTGTGRPVDG